MTNIHLSQKDQPTTDLLTRQHRAANAVHCSVHLYNTPGGKMVNAVHCTLQCSPHQETIPSETFTDKNTWYTWCCTYFFSLQISYQIQRTWQRIPTEEKPNLGCKYNVNTMQKAPRHSVGLERTAALLMLVEPTLGCPPVILSSASGQIQWGGNHLHNHSHAKYTDARYRANKCTSEHS